MKNRGFLQEYRHTEVPAFSQALISARVKKKSFFIFRGKKYSLKQAERIINYYNIKYGAEY